MCHQARSLGPNDEAVQLIPSLEATESIPSPHVSYQEILRALGASFDAANANGITLIEGDEEFVLQYGRRSAPQRRTVSASYSDVVALASLAARHRREIGSGNRSRRGAYEDVLRALGYELDRAVARSVLIHEVARGLVVAYQSRWSPGAGQPEVMQQTLDARRVATLLAAAYARRGSSAPSPDPITVIGASAEDKVTGAT
jgi:hypothetical protein